MMWPRWSQFAPAARSAPHVPSAGNVPDRRSRGLATDGRPAAHAGASPGSPAADAAISQRCPPGSAKQAVRIPTTGRSGR